MLDKMLKKVEKRMNSFDEKLRPPCSDADLKNLQSKSKQKLGYDIPEEYGLFLKTTNGLEWNGLIIYASKRTRKVGNSDDFIQGFVEANLDLRMDNEDLDKFLVFADGGEALYTYNIAKKKYQIVLTVGLDMMESYKTFDELISKALKEHM